MVAVSQKEIVEARRLRRQRRVRKRLFGTGGRPRLAVFRSSKHIYAQVVNDDDGRTLAQASTVDPEVRRELPAGSADAPAEGGEGAPADRPAASASPYGGNAAAAAVVGRFVAERAKQAGIDKVCFDRRSYKYHGRVRALAEAARAAGLQF